jgi:hypothetical protein
VAFTANFMHENFCHPQGTNLHSGYLSKLLYKTLRATPTEELSMVCNLYLSILERKDSVTIIVSGFPK